MATATVNNNSVNIFHQSLKSFYGGEPLFRYAVLSSSFILLLLCVPLLSGIIWYGKKRNSQSLVKRSIINQVNKET